MSTYKRRQTDVSEKPGYENCVRPLLTAMDWRGSPRQVTEALPHFEHIHTVFTLCEVLANLKYDYRTVPINLKKMDPRLLPCLYKPPSKNLWVLLEIVNGSLRVFDSALNQERVIELSKLDDTLATGTGYKFRPKKEEINVRRKSIKSSWLYKLYSHNKSLFFQGLLLSFFLSVFALTTPLYTMFVYDRVIGTGSLTMLSEFGVGIALIYIGIFLLHRIRARIIAMFGARLDHEVGNNIFQRLLYLAPAFTESANVGSQVARVRDFDRLRDFLTGPVLTILFEVPFIFIALGVIAILGGPLVFVPIAMIVVFILLFLLLRPQVSYRLAKSAEKGAKLQEFLLEAVSHMKVLKYTAAEDVWLKRYRELSADASITSLRLTMTGAVNNAISNGLMISSGLAILGFGAVQIINAKMTVGAMIAVMMLIWRLLGPLRSLYNIMPRLQQIIVSLKQIHRLMEIQTEVEPGDEVLIRPQSFKGQINFDRVSFRYPSSFNPALMGITFEIKPGMLVGIIGRNGSGKSTVMKLLLGMYQPQAGSIRIDNQDIRQVNPIELRKSIAYLPQSPELFYGTVAANLRLADPSASEQTLHQACERAGILEDILALPRGFDTQIRDHSKSQLSQSFQQGLCLARAYLRHTSIIMLDEPTNVLDDRADRYLMKALKELKGKCTILMISHRPSHLKMMDSLLLFDQGQLVVQGPPAAILPQVPQDLM